MLSSTWAIDSTCKKYKHCFSLHTNQGGQSCGQQDWVHRFPEPVISFINLLILNQISCGKVRKTHIFFCIRLCQSFSWVCCSFPDYLEQLKKKRNYLRDWVQTSVVRMIFSYILIFATSSAGNITSKIR